jgi:hypothetical protein
LNESARDQEFDMPGPFIPLVVGAYILVAADGPPKVDMQPTCQTSVEAVVSLFGNSTQESLAGCMSQQNDAFQKIKNNWASYPADARAHCVQTNIYMPSYIEWLTCFEMETDVRKMRADDAKAAQARAAPQRRRSPASRTGSETRPCPRVEFLADGSILSVDNC